MVWRLGIGMEGVLQHRGSLVALGLRACEATLGEVRLRRALRGKRAHLEQNLRDMLSGQMAAMLLNLGRGSRGRVDAEGVKSDGWP
jgi:hypothetical protein